MLLFSVLISDFAIDPTFVAESTAENLKSNMLFKKMLG